MSRNDPFEFVRLAGAELDDQAIGEISCLLRSIPEAGEVSLADLLRLAASGALVVARRPCGALPEIVGVAGVKLCARANRAEEIVAVDPDHWEEGLEAALRACLSAQSPRMSLVHGRDRASLCWPRAASA